MQRRVYVVKNRVSLFLEQVCNVRSHVRSVKLEKKAGFQTKSQRGDEPKSLMDARQPAITYSFVPGTATELLHAICPTRSI